MYYALALRLYPSFELWLDVSDRVFVLRLSGTQQLFCRKEGGPLSAHLVGRALVLYQISSQVFLGS